MNYDVIVSEQAKRDMVQIFRYIYENLKAKQTALNQLERLEWGIRSLDQFPYRYPVYNVEPWRSENIRIMPIDNYVVLYKPDGLEHKVKVIRVFGNRMNTDNKEETSI
mgnify:CR=1 FL=1